MGIWLLIYGIADKNHDRYIDWFHHTHIDEKLTRPGYDWAAHYKVQSSTSVQDHNYIALFGSASSRTFFDPSPKQLKPRQDALTREMIGYRTQPVSLVCTCEWSNVADKHHAIQSEWIALDVFDEKTDDQDVMAWCAQQGSPALEQDHLLHQLLASSGAPRHLTLVEVNQMTDSIRQKLETTDGDAPPFTRLLAQQTVYRQT